MTKEQMQEASIQKLIDDIEATEQSLYGLKEDLRVAVEKIVDGESD